MEPRRSLPDRAALRSAAVASLNQWARQWLPEGQAPLPPTSPLHRDGHSDTDEGQAADSTVLSLPERPRALDEAWSSFMAQVHAPAAGGTAPATPGSAIELPSHARRGHGRGGAETAPSPLALVAEASSAPLTALLQKSEGSLQRRRPASASDDAKAGDTDTGTGLKADTTPVGGSIQGGSPLHEGEEDATQAEHQRRFVAAVEAVALMDDLLEDLSQKSRAVAAERARFRAMCRLREREAAVRGQQARLMRLQRAMRGESVVSSSPQSHAAQARENGDERDSFSETGSRFRSAAARASHNPDADGGASVAVSSMSGSALLSSLGSSWATGAAVRLRNKVGARTGAGSVAGSLPSSRHLQRQSSASVPSVSHRLGTSGLADDPGAPDRSLPRLRKVDAPFAAPGGTGAVSAREDLSRGAPAERRGDVHPRFEASGIGAESALGAASSRAGPSSVHTSTGKGVGRTISVAESHHAALGSSSRTSVTAGGRPPPQSVARSSAQSYLPQRSVGNDAGSVVAPASLAGSSFSESHPRDFVRHNIEVAGTYAPTRRLAPSEEARLRTLLGDDEHTHDEGRGTPPGPAPQSPEAAASPGGGSVAPATSARRLRDGGNGDPWTVDDNTGYEPPAVMQERLQSIAGRLTELSSPRHAEHGNSAESARLTLLPFFITALDFDAAVSEAPPPLTPATSQRDVAGIDAFRVAATGPRSSSAPNALSLGFQPPAGRRRPGGTDPKGAIGAARQPSTRDGSLAGLPPLLPQPPVTRPRVGAAKGSGEGSPVSREREQRDEVRALFQRGVEERRARQRLAAVDAALEALRGAAPGDDVGLHDSMRQLGGSGSRMSERDTFLGGDGGGTVAGSHVTAATRASTGSTASAVLRRITARDILAEVQRAARHLRAPRGSSCGGEGGRPEPAGPSEPNGAGWGALELAPRASVLSLLAQLRAAGASHDALSGIMEAAVPPTSVEKED